MTARHSIAIPLALAPGDALSLSAIIDADGEVRLQRVAVAYANPQGGAPVATTFTYPDACPLCRNVSPCPDCDRQWTPDP